ncbi:hypothetical protein Tco_1290235 [Tanacetum coccineum]
MFYVVFDAGNHFVVPGYPSGACKTDNSTIIHEENLRVNMNIGVEDFVVGIFQPRHGLAFGVTSASGSCQVSGSCFREWGVSGSWELFQEVVSFSGRDSKIYEGLDEVSGEEEFLRTRIS